MHLRSIFLVLIPLVMVSAARSNVMSQMPSPNRWYEKGMKAFEAHDYPKAVEYFEWSSQRGGGWKSELMLARAYREQLDYAKARQSYAKIIEQPGIPSSTYFYYAQSLLASKDYVGAQKWFERYAEMEPQNPKSVVFSGLDKMVASYLADTLQFQVQKLPINSPFSDFSPCFYQNGIYFVSGRTSEFGVKHINVLDGAELLDIYFASLDTAGKWSKPKLVNSLNSNYNEGPMAIDTIHQRLFLTRNDPNFKLKKQRHNHAYLNRLRIESLSWIDGKWLDPQLLNINNLSYAVGHPSLSPDGNTLFFASDMPGGFGGTDLYRATWDGKAWTDLQNLGDGINTTEDELFPYFSSEGELYFSSAGHLGFGGLDIFFCQQIGNGQFGRIQNLGYPINSELDDFGLIASADGNSGYFSSNRGTASLKNDDIYSYKRDWPRFECAPMVKNNYCYLYSDDGLLDIDTLPFAYEWRFGDGFKARGLEARHCYEGPGTYEIEFYIYDTIANQIFLNVNSYFLTIKDSEQVTISVPDTVRVGERISMSAEKSILPGCEMDRFFWEFGDGQRAQGISQEHIFTAPGQYEVKLGVTGTPATNADLICKNCVTKMVEVVSQSEMELILQSRIERQAAAIEKQTIWEKPQNLPTVKQPIDSAELPQYALKLLESGDSLDPTKAPFHEFKFLRSVAKGEGFVIYEGKSEDPLTLAPSFFKAQRLGFDDAIVVVLPKDSSNQSQPSFEKIELPIRKNENGYSVYFADILDSQGNPVIAQLTFQDLERGNIKYQAISDSSGHVEMQLPNGQMYAWTANVKNFLPASGFLDLSSDQELIRTEFNPRAKITLNTVSELRGSGEPFRLNNIFFDFDSDRLRPESIEQINRLAKLLTSDPSLRIEVSAHTDNVGEDAYNMDLSRRRAYAVVRYMVLAGYNVEQLKPVGYGESMPVVPNDSPIHRQLNRRVEFKFLPQL